MDPKFKIALEYVLKHEGGYSNNPNDPGGETNFGISKRSYPNLDIKNLTVAQARGIYYNDYWKNFNLDQIKDVAVAAKCMDLIVNAGTGGIKIIQKAMNLHGNEQIKVDGALGPATIARVNEMTSKHGAYAVLALLSGSQFDRYRALARHNPSLKRFFLGWAARAYSYPSVV